MARETSIKTALDLRDSSVARLGGDEFVILLSELRCVEDAAVVAKRVIESLASPFLIEDTEVFITASIGISAYPTDGEDADTLMKEADGAMYEAKQEGRNGYHFYTADTQARAFERLSMEASLRRALEADQFVLHYQPKIETHSGKVTGMEALVRWEHPEMGLISPADFIPIAEETGLIVPLGQWVLDCACAQTKEWQMQGLAELQVSVNMSAAQLREGELPVHVSQTLAAHALAPDTLDLELTESLLMDNVRRAHRPVAPVQRNWCTTIDR